MSLKGFLLLWTLLILEQTSTRFCSLLDNDTLVNKEKSEADQPPSAKSHVVVFDVDNTLCKPGLTAEEVKNAEKNHSECPLLHWTHDGKDYPHIFLPHLQILFEYLLEKGVRIVFFSSALKERNTVVIPDLLISFWGTKKFKALKFQGQFSIFSREDMRRGSRQEGHFAKDLRTVLQKGESLSDVILVEDDTSYTARDQRPCLKIYSLEHWYLRLRNYQCSNGSALCFPKNMVYFMLGVFTTYFERSDLKTVPFREGLLQILPKSEIGDYGHINFKFNSHFARSMIDLGLSEVKKKVPTAKSYGQYESPY